MLLTSVRMLRSTSSGFVEPGDLLELLFPFPFPFPWQEVSDDVCLGGRGREDEGFWMGGLESLTSMSGGSGWVTMQLQQHHHHPPHPPRSWTPATVQRTENKTYNRKQKTLSHRFIFYSLQDDQQEVSDIMVL